jgi:hypothetical protein
MGAAEVNGFLGQLALSSTETKKRAGLTLDCVRDAA